MFALQRIAIGVAVAVTVVVAVAPRVRATDCSAAETRGELRLESVTVDGVVVETAEFGETATYSVTSVGVGEFHFDGRFGFAWQVQ